MKSKDVLQIVEDCVAYKMNKDTNNKTGERDLIFEVLPSLQLIKITIQR